MSSVHVIIDNAVQVLSKDEAVGVYELAPREPIKEMHTNSKLYVQIVKSVIRLFLEHHVCPQRVVRTNITSSSQPVCINILSKYRRFHIRQVIVTIQ